MCEEQFKDLNILERAETNTTWEIISTPIKINFKKTGYYKTPRGKNRQNTLGHKSQQYLFRTTS